MKISKGILILAVAILGFASCKKDDVASPKNLEGTWEGAWGFDNDTPTYYERWEINDNGDITAYDEDDLIVGEGSWDITGNNVEVEYTHPLSLGSYIFVGQYDDAKEEITGTWGESPSSTNGGKFEMEKD